MDEYNTYIKLSRKILSWRWFHDSKILHVFIWLLLKANIKEGHFQKDVIHRGMLATSNAHIAEECGMTLQNVRTALLNLESTGEIKRESRNHYQIITIVNYEMYQNRYSRNSRANDSDISEQAVQLTSNSQATNNNQRIKEYKNGKKEKNKEKKPSPSPLDGVGDVPKAVKLKPIGEGTVDDIPEEFRDFCKTYEEYWGFRNR